MRFSSTTLRAGHGSTASYAAAAVLLALPAAVASAAPLTNGNFEAAGGGADNTTTTFPNWTESNGNAAVRASAPLGGSGTSALLTGNGGTLGTLSQAVTPLTNTFDFSFDFAAVNPGGASPSTNDRALQLLLTGSNGAQINLIIIRGSSPSVGSVQVFGGSFQSIASQADQVDFSPSLANPVLNTLRLAGSIGGGYTITTNGVTSGAVTFYQGSSSASTPTDFATVNFTTVNAATVNYVVDNVALTPEPASAGVFAAVMAGGLLRRRRRR